MNELSMIVRQMRVFSERKLQNRNLGFPEQLVLMYLSQGRECNQEQIAQHLGIDKGAIAKTIGKLEAKGLIKRQENPENKREKRISITAQANAVLGEMSQILQEWNDNIYAGISSEDIKEMERIIGKMAKNSNKLIADNQ
ncbi:MAG: MarR family transcriptional regulator [Clostridiales bacterium]